jgi:hypothetical protein
MNRTSHQRAQLPDSPCERLPHIALPIDARFQYAVDCGVIAACAFFDEDQSITLHAHLPASLEFFLRQTRKGAAALGVNFSDTSQAIADAFCAGYLGRIQQELRIMRPRQPHAHHASGNAFH